MPDTVIALDVITVFSATLVWSVKVKASGVVSGATYPQLGLLGVSSLYEPPKPSALVTR
jgi:hypothetical protein